MFNLGLFKGKRKEKKKERPPLSMRNKRNSLQERRVQEPKVKGWDTYADDFVDFM